MDRRSFLHAGLAASAAAAASASLARADEPSQAAPGPAIVHGKLRQSVCRWCFGGMSLDELCGHAKTIGLQSVELLGPDEWEVTRRHGLTCAVANGPGGIVKGWNRVEHHDALVAASESLLPRVAAAGIPCMIVFSGNRGGMADAEGLRNCAAGLARIMPQAESLGVTVIMELLNSKVDHGDYMCDRTPWGVELCKAINSNRFKLLYDIYHMQIMEGDIIRTIRENAPYIAHYHTAGNPGRSNLDDTQELDYRGICKAIVATGYTGYLGQEFMPRGDAVAALRSAAALCDVA